MCVTLAIVHNKMCPFIVTHCTGFLSCGKDICTNMLRYADIGMGVGRNSVCALIEAFRYIFLDWNTLSTASSYVQCLCLYHPQLRFCSAQVPAQATNAVHAWCGDLTTVQ